MGIAIRFLFLAGRYGATAWDRNPNEGIAEWPPAPWRVLRAIVAAAYRADGDPDPQLLATVIEALGTPPRYRLPRATSAHTRSYQPLFGIDPISRRQKTTLVLDAFVVVGGGAVHTDASVVLEWPGATLETTATEALDRWLAQLGYLGRAESWVEATRVEVGSTRPSVERADMADLRANTVRLLTPAATDGKQLVAALTTDTQTLFQQRLAIPPAACWVDYSAHEPLLRAPLFGAPQRSAMAEAPTLVRLALGTRVHPRLTDAVRFGERVRAALMSRSRRNDGMPHPVFSGKTPAGIPLQGNSHLHVLPLDEDRDGGIDHVLLWAPGGFDAEAMHAIEGLTWLWGDDGVDMRLAMTGVATEGNEDRMAALGIPAMHRERSTAAGSTQWCSRTPFVLPRHPKLKRGQLRDGPEEQLRREFARMGLPLVLHVRGLAATDAPNDVQWHRFRLHRTGGSGSRGGDRGYGFTVTFAAPVNGPLAVGYGARQGLGQFEPIP